MYMNNIIFQDFSQKLRNATDSVVVELSKQPIDPKDAMNKLKVLRGDIIHLMNLLKIEEHLENKNK